MRVTDCPRPIRTSYSLRPLPSSRRVRQTKASVGRRVCLWEIHGQKADSAATAMSEAANDAHRAADGSRLPLTISCDRESARLECYDPSGGIRAGRFAGTHGRTTHGSALAERLVIYRRNVIATTENPSGCF